MGQAPAPAAASAALDVASVKPSSPDSRGQSMMMSPGKFNTENEPLMGLIKFAYNLKSDDQLLGAPGWIGSKGFDIDAKEDAAFVEEAGPSFFTAIQGAVGAQAGIAKSPGAGCRDRPYRAA